MKHANKQIKIILVLYGILVCMAIVLLLVIACTENVQVYEARSGQEQYTVEDVVFRETEDGSAPAGVRQTYKWTLPEQIEEDSCLAFYTVHQYIEVYFDEELMYSLAPQPDNRIGRTVGSNWIVVPLYPKDTGREVRVEVTPVYGSARTRTVTFYTGAYLRIYMNQMKKDLPQIILGALAVLLGAVFCGMSLYNRLRRKSGQMRERAYLGMFSIIIGIWKLSDTRFSPLMFPKNPLLLSHITMVMLLLAPVPLLLFVRSCFRDTPHRVLDAACILSILSGMGMVVLQAANIMDFRESLPASHVVIVLTAAAIAADAARNWKQGEKNQRTRVAAVGFLVCTAGALVDLLLYYVRGNSSGILYTLAAFLLYVTLIGVSTSRELNYRAHIDMHTGLYNKSCCSERFHEKGLVAEDTAVFMFDLNGLKRVNDTVGHEVGDNMIFQFAEILRKNLPFHAFVGRYGGDEFVAILQPADDAAVRRALADVAGAVERYNRGDVQVPISYAVGSAISTEHPGGSMQELLEAADTAMYQEKRRQYAAGQAGV